MYIVSRSDVIKVIIPPLLAFTLFVVTLFGLVLPALKTNLLAQKKEAIAVLTQTAANVLNHYDALAQSGKLSRDKAQTMAVHQV